jgi:hypothetical protein
VRSQHEQKWSATLVREHSPDHFPYLILSGSFQPRLAAFRAALLEACPGADAGRLDAGLIHLLYRGFGVMGLPAKSASAPGDASADASAMAMLARLERLDDPACVALQRIFQFNG